MWSFVIQNIYGFVSIIFYIFISSLTVRERRFFNPSFVKLWVTLTIVNILSYVTMYCAMRLPQHVSSESSFGRFLATFPFPRALTLLLFLVYYLAYCQNITIFLMTLNRLRAIACPFSREAIWDNNYWLTVTFILVCPLFFCYNILWYEAEFRYKEGLGGFIIAPTHPNARDELLQLMFFECAVTILCLVVNISSIVMLCRKSMSSNYRRERNLFLISFLGFVFQTVNSMVSAALYIFPQNSLPSTLALYSLPFVDDLFSLSIPYFFIVFNLRIRTCFFELPIFSWIANVKVFHQCEKQHPVMV